jgi:ribosome-associated protein
MRRILSTCSLSSTDKGICASSRLGNKAKARAFQELETMRDELVAGNNALIEEIISRFPDCDRQHLRQLARNAQREFSANKPPTQQRKLFRYLRELSEA